MTIHAHDAAAPAPENLLGICHAVGTLLGFDPEILRLALIAAVLVNLELALVVYAMLGAAVLLARR